MARVATITLPEPHGQQQRVVTDARRFNVVACGRRWGKTMLGVDRCITTAAQGAPVAWFAPSYKLMEEPWAIVRRMARPPIATRVDQQQRRVELASGGVIDFWTLDGPEGRDAGRGRKYALVVIDEAAMVRYLAEAWHEAIRPTLTDLKGSAWFMSTPKGRNFFWELWRKGEEREQEWRSWRMPTATNPHIDPVEIEAARGDLPERRFAQEYLAEFLEDEGAVFRRVTDACTAVQQLRSIPGHAYLIGVDWGKSNDYTVIAVIDATMGALVHIDRTNRVDYAVQVERLRDVHGRFPTARILAESNAMGEPILEQLRRAGLPVRGFQTTAASKAAIIEGLSLAIEQGRLDLLPTDWLKHELLAFEMTRLPSGMMRYSAPEGMHDDGVMALAIAWSGAGTGGKQVASSGQRTTSKLTGYLT